MRLPADAVLIVIGREATEAIRALAEAWSREALPILQAPDAAAEWEARLDALGATTLVICGTAPPEAVAACVRSAAALGYRLFVVAEACPQPLDFADLARDSARIVSLALTLQAAPMANFRRRWRAARGPAG